MKFALHSIFVFCGYVMLSLHACTSNSATDKLSSESLQQENSVEPYPSFSNFPNQQFRSLSLGETHDQIKKHIEKMSVQLMAAEEDNYFFFPADSTELIIPNSPILNEFKIFLKSRTYLDNSATFKDFISENASEKIIDDHYSVYFYQTKITHFKLTFYEQQDFIRIHFILTKSHL